MRWFRWLVLFLIPLVVLYTIGYYVPGFSALTIPWIIGLSLIITIGEGIVHRAFGRVSENRLGKGLVDFFLATVVIFTVTLAINGGNVPLRGALLAAAIIAILSGLLNLNLYRMK